MERNSHQFTFAAARAVAAAALIAISRMLGKPVADIAPPNLAESMDYILHMRSLSTPTLGFQNIGDAPSRILVLFSPAGMEAFFDRFAQLPPGPVEPSVFAALGRDVGMDVLGPPLAISDPL